MKDKHIMEKTKRAKKRRLQTNKDKAKRMKVSEGLKRKVGYHECEIFVGGESETAESEYKWQHCEKNPRHTDFLTAKQFRRHILPSVKTPKLADELQCALNRTVRLRVHTTSLGRPDDDELAENRGSDKLRTGTGFVTDVSDVEYHRSCPCEECDGNVTPQHWTFCVDTALHVVYNTEEAKETKIDLFFDDDRSDRDGRMKSVWGINVLQAHPERDLCKILCATHDEDLVERIRSAWIERHDRTRSDVVAANLHSGKIFGAIALVISHPHGQPKKVTHGKIILASIDEQGVQYRTPTCSGSSGAPVFLIEPSLENATFLSPLTPAHSGSYTKNPAEEDDEQHNFGYLKFLTN